MSDSDDTRLIVKTYPIEDDYVLSLEEIGTGMTGSIYACFHRLTGVKHAMKVSEHTRFKGHLSKDFKNQAAFSDSPQDTGCLQGSRGAL